MRRDGDQQLGFRLAGKRGGITARVLETPGERRIRRAQSRDEHCVDALGAIDRIEIGKRDAVCGGPHDLRITRRASRILTTAPTKTVDFTVPKVPNPRPWHYMDMPARGLL